MNEPTDGDTPADSPAAFAYCAWHQGYTDDARLVRAIEQGSGPGAHLFACAPCRDVHRLTPLADQQ